MATTKRTIGTVKLLASSVILDIEGTTSSISFVKDVLFPYVRNNLESYVNENWDSTDFQECVKALKKQAQQDEDNNVEGVVTIPEEGEDSSLKTALIDNIKWQMDHDKKTKSLKDLQGMIMEKGYKNGDLKGHVYEDVEQSLKSWVELDKSVYIYSSGSVHAQKLLFGHSEKGDLLPLIKGHFDTTVGMKGDVDSYKEILKQISSNPSETAFFTDVPKEAKAAKEAGITALLVSREGNAPLSDEDRAEFQVITSFEDIEFEENCKKRKTSSPEMPVNIDNKEVVSCSLSLKNKNKPLSPELISNNEKSMDTQETSTQKSNEFKSINKDELMDVDEISSDKASNENVKTNENTSDTTPQDNSSEVTNKENTSSAFKNESSIPETEEGCSSEDKKVEDVKNPIGSKSEETIIQISAPGELMNTPNEDQEQIKCKNQANDNQIENNEAEENSKVSTIETSTIQPKIEVEKIENHKEENNVSVIPSEVGIKCQNDNESSIENVDVEMNNSQSKDTENAIKEGEEKITNSSNNKTNNSEDAKKIVETPSIHHEANEKMALSVCEEKKSSSSDAEDNTKCNKKTSSDLTVLNENKTDKNTKETEDKPKGTSNEETPKVENVETSAIAEDQQKEKENCISNDLEENKEDSVSELSNGVGNDNLGDKAVSKEESVELVNENKISLKENDELVASQNISSTNADDHKESSQISEECEVDTNLVQSKDMSTKPTDVIECIKNTEKTKQNIESNGLNHVDSTNNETEVPVVKKTEDKIKEAMDELQEGKQENDKTNVVSQNGKVSIGEIENLNGASSPDLKAKNNGLTEEALEDKKCKASENTSVETVIEA